MSKVQSPKSKVRRASAYLPSNTFASADFPSHARVSGFAFRTSRSVWSARSLLPLSNVFEQRRSRDGSEHHSRSKSGSKLRALHTLARLPGLCSRIELVPPLPPSTRTALELLVTATTPGGLGQPRPTQGGKVGRGCPSPSVWV